MGWTVLIWALKLFAVLGTVEASFKALKQPQTRKRRIAGLAQTQAAPTSAERMRKRMIKVQLTNWVVLACFLWTERIADRTISWIIPLYDELKVLTLLSILVWRSAGAELVFRKIIKPSVTPYERPLDGLSFLVGEALDVILFLVLSGPRWIRNRFHKTDTATEDEVPAIMRSLRAPGRPPLASHLADSIELTRAHLTHVPEPSPPSNLSRASSSSTTTTTTTTRVNPLPFRPTLHQSRSSREPLPTPPAAPIAGPSRVSYRNVYPVLPPPLPKPTPEPEREPEFTRPREEAYVHPQPPPPPAARTTTTARKVSAASTAAKGKARAVPATTTTTAPPKRTLRSQPDLAPTPLVSIPDPPPPPIPTPIPTLSHSHSSSHSLSRSTTPLQPALRNPSVLSLSTSVPRPLPPPSPKQLALSAIRDLSNDISPFDFSPAAAAATKGPRKSLLSLSTATSSTAAPKAETKRKSNSRVSNESPRKRKTVVVGKEEDEYRPEQDADVEDEDEDTSRTRSTASSRKRRVSQLEPSASSSDDGTTTATESLAPSKKPKSPSPVKKPRLRAPAPTKTKSKLPTPAPSTSTEEDAFVVRRPRQAGRVVSSASGAPPTRVTAASRVPVVGGVASGSGSGSGSGTTVVRKKARRVLGTNGGVLSDREEDGVPVVKRRRG